MYPKLIPLISYLDSLNKRVDMGHLQNLLNELKINSDDIKNSCIFSDESYARNKISGSDWYDIYAMCWKHGQCSAIHDHEGSACGFKVIQGICSEIKYRDSSTGNNKERTAVKTEQCSYKDGDVCVAFDKEIHKILNDTSPEGLITLHVYSPPLHMNYYTEDTSFKKLELGSHSAE